SLHSFDLQCDVQAAAAARPRLQAARPSLRSPVAVRRTYHKGLATKIDDSAPTTMPTIRVRVKSLIVLPPNTYSATRTKSVVRPVLTERESDWRMLTFVSSASVSRVRTLRFSRILSKMTIVSLIA